QLNKLVLLGEKLFFDEKLSGNLSVSCATCHQPNNYFNDNLTKSNSITKDEVLKRNTPGIFYASWQHNQFWEGRANNMQDQIKDVIFNPLEMNGSHPMLLSNVIKAEEYKDLLKLSFPDKEINNMGIDEISLAISAYI